MCYASILCAIFFSNLCPYPRSTLCVQCAMCARVTGKIKLVKLLTAGVSLAVGAAVMLYPPVKMPG